MLPGVRRQRSDRPAQRNHSRVASMPLRGSRCVNSHQALKQAGRLSAAAHSYRALQVLFQVLLSDNLSDQDPFVSSAAALPISAAVPYHSIIGNYTPERPLADSADGVVPFCDIFLTNGQARTLRLGAHQIEIRRAPAWLMLLGATRAGDAVRALEWIGEPTVMMAVARLHTLLSESEWQELESAQGFMPNWIAKL